LASLMAAADMRPGASTSKRVRGRCQHVRNVASAAGGTRADSGAWWFGRHVQRRVRKGWPSILQPLRSWRSRR
jgi:hypothetical protein